MPNHVMNKLRAPAAIVDSIINKDGHVDFNLVIKMPESLQIDKISGIDMLAKFFWKKCVMGVSSENLTDDYITNFIKDTAERKLSDENFMLLALMMRNIRDHGVTDWYDWSISRWGTKWNAYETVIEPVDEHGYKVVSFQTAWSSPLPIITELAKKHPAKMYFTYADEDIGSNCGALSYHNGEIQERTLEDPDRFAIEQWGYDYEEYMAERKV